uniref:Uncharacterized protein n=1 Tax=Anopheles farauti TaxID=69004 RepID=A0A182QJS1_9DIPT
MIYRAQQDATVIVGGVGSACATSAADNKSDPADRPAWHDEGSIAAKTVPQTTSHLWTTTLGPRQGSSTKIKKTPTIITSQPSQPAGRPAGASLVQGLFLRTCHFWCHHPGNVFGGLHSSQLILNFTLFAAVVGSWLLFSPIPKQHHVLPQHQAACPMCGLDPAARLQEDHFVPILYKILLPLCTIGKGNTDGWMLEMEQKISTNRLAPRKSDSVGRVLSFHHRPPLQAADI